MALEFKCPHCGAKIVSKFLNIGEKIECKDCKNSSIIPNSATGSSEALKRENTISDTFDNDGNPVKTGKLSKKDSNPTILESELSKKEAKVKLKEAKENLDLELITQEEYDNLKKKLKPIIMDEDALDNADANKQDENNSSEKSSNMNYMIPIFIVICLTITFIHKVLKSPSHTASPTTSETNSKPITDMEARQMVLDELYKIDDYFIDIKNGEWVRFVYLTNDGRDSQILSISAKSPKNSAIIEILHRGNPVKINSRWSFLKPLK